MRIAGGLLQCVFVGICALMFTNCEQSKIVQKPNVLLICIDDLRPELKSFGAEYISSPNIDKLTELGISFRHHYVNAPSCGPSRFTLLTGIYGPPSNQALFQRAGKIDDGGENVHPSLPEWFRRYGYTTVSVGKVSHHPGGMGGENWDDSNLREMPNAWDRELIPVGVWEHPRGLMHGLANGEKRIKASDMDVFQSVEGDDNIYPDGLITNEALKQLSTLASDDKKPFFLAIGIMKPHLPFGAPRTYLRKYQGVKLPAIAHPQKPAGKTTWHGSGEFRQYNHWDKDANEDTSYADDVRRHYAACVSYADAQVGKILAELKRTGADKNTIVVLWGDHGWHLGEHGIWGKHSLFEESLRSPLIIRSPEMKHANVTTNSIVESIDIFPTLCDLSGIEAPLFTQGKSLSPIIDNPNVEGHAAIAYTHNAKTIRTANHRMTLHQDGFVELYDHRTVEKETKNVAADKPQLVDRLMKELYAKLK